MGKFSVRVNDQSVSVPYTTEASALASASLLRAALFMIAPIDTQVTVLDVSKWVDSPTEEEAVAAYRKFADRKNPVRERRALQILEDGGRGWRSVETPPL